VRRIVLIGFVSLSLASVVESAFAISAKSSTYEFEYTSIGIGGGTSQAADYTMVTNISELGDAQPASSSSYSMEPAVGVSTLVTPVTLSGWSAE